MAAKPYKKTKWPDPRKGRVCWVCKTCRHVFWSEDVARTHCEATGHGGGSTKRAPEEEPVPTLPPVDEQE